MIEYWKYRLNLSKLFRQKEKTRAAFAKDIRKARKDGKARRRFVPIPSRETDEMWEQCDTISNRYVLTDKGISQLRSSLRKEFKAQVELIVTVLAVLTGIIGAITGLVAVIMK